MSASNLFEYEVVSKVRESDTITSFYLSAADGSQLPSFQPGEHLTFCLPVAEGSEAGSLYRNYSLSGNNQKSTYRLSIKCEPSPFGRDDIPPGLGSNYFHDSATVGTRLKATRPQGQFTLDTDDNRPVVLLSGGVGLTPLVSMLHSLATEGARETWFIHACDNSAVHALGAEARELGQYSTNVHTHFCYRIPCEGDRQGSDYDSTGFVTRELLQRLLPLDSYCFYLCGPPPFMQAMYKNLLSLGVQKTDIKYEFFGPATVLFEGEPEPCGDQAENSADTSVVDTANQNSVLITFATTGRTEVWESNYNNLLEFAEAKGLHPEFSCRSGICTTCQCSLLSGQVSYVDEPLDEPEAGSVLICSAVPDGNVELGI